MIEASYAATDYFVSISSVIISLNGVCWAIDSGIIVMILSFIILRTLRLDIDASIGYYIYYLISSISIYVFKWSLLCFNIFWVPLWLICKYWLLPNNLNSNLVYCWKLYILNISCCWSQFKNSCHLLKIFFLQGFGTLGYLFFWFYLTLFIYIKVTGSSLPPIYSN